MTAGAWAATGGDRPFVIRPDDAESVLEDEAEPPVLPPDVAREGGFPGRPGIEADGGRQDIACADLDGAGEPSPDCPGAHMPARTGDTIDRGDWARRHEHRPRRGRPSLIRVIRRTGAPARIVPGADLQGRRNHPEQGRRTP